MSPSPSRLTALRAQLQAILTSPTPLAEAEKQFGLTGAHADKVLGSAAFKAPREKAPGGSS